MYLRQLTSAALVALAFVGSACGGGADQSSEDYLRKGDAFLIAANYNAAILEYRNALKADPQLGRARFQLGRALESSNDIQGARNEYVRAADLMPQDMEAQLAAARILLRVGERQDAKSRAESALKIDSSNADAHLIRGRAAAGSDEFDEARQAFEQGLAAQPGRSDLYVNLGMLEAVRGGSAEAEASFKQAIAVAPESFEARFALADYYWYTGRLPEAEKTFHEAAALEKGGSRTYRMLATFYFSTGRMLDAEAPLKKAVAASSDSRLKLILSDYYAATNRPNEAIPILEQLAKQPDMFAAASLTHAELDYRQGRREAAYALLEQVLRQQPKNANALVTKGQFLLLDQRVDEALTNANAALAAESGNWRAHELLGIIYFRRHQLSEAGVSLREAVRINPRALEAQLKLAELNVLVGKSSDAVRFADEAVRAQPSNPQAHYILARALMADGNLERARRELQLLAKDSAIVQVAFGELEARAGNAAAARAAFERAAATDATSTDAVAGLVALDAADKRLPQAVARVERLTKSAPNNVAALYLAARTHASAGNMPAAESAARKAVEVDPTFRPAYDLLGTVYRQQKRLPEALQMYERLVMDRPTDVPANMMVGTLQMLLGNEARARAQFEKVLSIDPRAALAANNLAYMDAEDGTNLDVALNRAQVAKSAMPDDADINDTLGWVYVKRGLPALAFAPLEQAIQKGPSNPVYHYHLGIAYLRAGDKERARPALERALQLSPSFEHAADAKQALAGLGQ